MMKKRILAAACGLLGTCKIFAATPLEPVALGSIGESVFFSELPVVLSVSRLAQTMHDAPGAITVIDAEMIRQSGARDLAELLRFVPGFQVGFSSNGFPVAAYHGLSGDVPQDMQLLVDGRSLHTPFSAGIGWDLIDVSLQDIERIEVLRGSNAAAYGSNAFKGVINVITRSAADSRGAVFSFANGNQGVDDRYARLGFGGDDIDVRLSMEENNDEGLNAYYDNRQSRRAGGRLEWRLGNSDFLSADFGELQVEMQTGYSPGVTSSQQTYFTKPRRMVHTTSTYGQLAWQHSFSPSSDFSARYSQARQERSDRFLIASPVFFGPFSTYQDEGVKAQRDDFEMQQTLALSGSLRVVLGAGYRRDAVSNDFHYGIGKTRTQYLRRVFGHGEWQIGSTLTVNAGATEEEDSYAGKTFSPRLMFNFHLLPKHTVKLGYTRARRLPTLFEAYADEKLYDVATGGVVFTGVRSAGTVRPASISEREISYVGEFPEFGLTADVRGFDERLGGWIEIGGGNVNNALDARIRGIETIFDWKPVKLSRFLFSYTKLGIKPKAIAPLGNQSQTRRALSFVAHSAPSDSWSLTWTQTMPYGVTLSAAWYDVASFKWTRNTIVHRYQRLDWRLAYPLRLQGGIKGELAWVSRGDGGTHAEWDAESGAPQTLHPRHYLTFRADY